MRTIIDPGHLASIRSSEKLSQVSEAYTAALLYARLWQLFQTIQSPV